MLCDFIVSVLSPQPVGYILASNLFSVLILNLALLNCCGQWKRRSRCHTRLAGISFSIPKTVYCRLNPCPRQCEKIIGIAPYSAGFRTSLNCLLPFLALRADSATRFTAMPKESGKHADSRVAPKEREVEELQSGNRFGYLSHMLT